ncbi:hypothetical protein [Parerythrobacter lacustris]|uniref:Uncharacterized protein n=1 Tax=Parerythrobacter lacustris TaxID=2969984 RepID=A0ABT1XQY9_9SPHN|nr:hypothetical protein [Parerythrobacter lacustris]MCR2834080.1 hypothetical protein [Parerythrobacter lacustris]
MKFVAEHLSFEQIDDVWTFALGDRHPQQPDVWVILTFGDEQVQDVAQGMTGLYIETSTGGSGYGYVECLQFEETTLLIQLCDDYETICVFVPARHAAIAQNAVEACNAANATRSVRPS